MVSLQATRILQTDLDELVVIFTQDSHEHRRYPYHMNHINSDRKRAVPREAMRFAICPLVSDPLDSRRYILGCST